MTEMRRLINLMEDIDDGFKQIDYTISPLALLINLGKSVEPEALDIIHEKILESELPGGIANFSDTGEPDYWLNETIFDFSELLGDLYLEFDMGEVYCEVYTAGHIYASSDNTRALSDAIPVLTEIGTTPVTGAEAVRVLFKTGGRYMVPIMEYLSNGTDPEPELMKIYHQEQMVRNKLGHPKASAPQTDKWDLDQYEKWQDGSDENNSTSNELNEIKRLAGH